MLIKRPFLEQPSDASIKHIALTKGQIAIVDADDYEWLNSFPWCAKWHILANQYRAERSIRGESGKQKTIGMHRFLMMAPDGMQVDHINHNCLDNRRSNLRICTPSENCYNRKVKSDSKTGIKGVRVDAYGFTSSITVKGKKKYLGYFMTAEDAHEAYKKASIDLHGEFSIYRT